MGEDKHDHLIGLVIAEAREITGGLTLTGEQAQRYIRRTLAGRDDVARPATWLRARMRKTPDELFALATGAELPAAADHRPSGLHPSARPIAEVIPNYAERREQVLAYYAEDERRKAAGLPFQWQERETATRTAREVELAEELRRQEEAARSRETAPPVRDVLPDLGSYDPLPDPDSGEAPF